MTNESKPAPQLQGEYLPCPFCGNASINLTVIDDRSFIMCNSCGACCDSIDTLPESEPGDVWNRRAAPSETDMRSVALAAGAYTTAYSMMTHAKVHNADVAGSTVRLATAINGLRSALGQPTPVAEDAARYRWLRHGDNDELVLRKFDLPSEYPLQYMLRGEKLDNEIDLIRAQERAQLGDGTR